MWSRLATAILLLSTCSTIPAETQEKFRYDNYKVYSVNIQTEPEFHAFKRVEATLQLDTWKEPRELGDYFDVVVPPSKLSKFRMQMQSGNFSHTIKIEDIQAVIDSQQPKTRISGLEWTQFHTLDEINFWLDQIAHAYPDVVTPFNIGRSTEGRVIKGIKISYKPGNKAVFIESNIHAREWITSSTITYIINGFLTSEDAKVRDIAENVDWYIIPVLNVDGFVYSHELKRLWRKSRLLSYPGATGTCVGTDLNRNFDFFWMLVGASDNPCSEIYAGPYAQSDPEINQMVQFIEDIDQDIGIYISLHSYGQKVLSPWGHTDEEFPEHYPQMMEVAKGYSDALKNRYGTTYTFGSSSTTLYKVSGSGKEWAYGIKGIPVPYTIELPDEGKYGFIMPPEKILPVAQETLDGFIGMIAAGRKVNVI